MYSIRLHTNSPKLITSSFDNQVIDWGIGVVMAPLAWRKTRGEGVKVAVLDTGCDYTHPDLSIVKGINFSSDDRSDYMDRQGHGTHVTGLIAAKDNSIGCVGVAPDAKLYVAKILDDDGNGTLEWAERGVEWAIEQGVDIISMSLGAVNVPTQFHSVFQKAYKANIAVVAAAGNEGGQVHYPAAYPETIAVGAISSDLECASFSNTGETIDLVAPGVDVYSTWPGGRYALLSGTSMATPIVAGCLALLISRLRQLGQPVSVVTLNEKLRSSGVDLGLPGHDMQYGHGMVNLSKLLR